MAGARFGVYFFSEAQEYLASELHQRESTAGPAKLRAVVPAAASAGPTHTALAALLLVVLAFALALLGGCGPGLGGTGTGATADAMAAYGARDVPVCESDFADLIGCNAPSAGAAPLPAGGALAESSPASADALLALDGNEAAVESALRRHRLHRQLGQVGRPRRATTATPSKAAAACSWPRCRCSAAATGST
ncbi:MAG: hypothetical protein U1F25_18120 [Rubrivivax sp.]